MMISVHVISDSKELLEIESIWNKMIYKHSENPFLLSEFVRHFVEFNSSKGWIPSVLVIMASNELIGIAPLMVNKKFGLRFAKFLYKPWFSPDFIFDNHYRETCMEYTFEFLFDTLRCQLVDIPLPADSPNLQIINQKCTEKGVYCWTKQEIGHCVIPVNHTWEEFRSIRGYNFRRRFKRIERKMDRAGSWRTIKVENEKQKLDATQRIFDVERRSWKSVWRTRRGIEMDQELLMILDGLQQTARTEPDFNWSVWFLELNDETLAYTLILQYKETSFIVKTSFDERYRKLQPGIYINNVAIRELFNRREARNIDWLTDLRFHRNWTDVSLPRLRVTMSRSRAIRTIIGSVWMATSVRKLRGGVNEKFVDPLLEKAPAIASVLM